MAGCARISAFTLTLYYFKRVLQTAPKSWSPLENVLYRSRVYWRFLSFSSSKRFLYFSRIYSCFLSFFQKDYYRDCECIDAFSFSVNKFIIYKTFSVSITEILTLSVFSSSGRLLKREKNGKNQSVWLVK